MNIETAIEKAVELAKIGAVVFPPLGVGAELAEKVLDVVDSLKAHAPTDQSKDQLEQAHRELYDAMIAKGHALSDELRGS